MRIDMTPEGILKYSVKENMVSKVEREIATCNKLIQRLNLDGGTWGPAEEFEEQASPIDCISADKTGNKLKIQVTEAEDDEEIWEQLARGNTIKGQLTLEELADRLNARITAKARKTGGIKDIVLAIDASKTNQYVCRQVVECFASRCGQLAASVPFKQIWLVGPSPDLTYLLV